MKKLSNISRWILGGSVLAAVAGYFLPLWKIQLWAPQYPEGLTLKIWYNNLKGDVDVINGLNHYIGMKHLTVEGFPEFKILGALIAGFIGLGLFIAYKGTMNWLKIYLGIMIVGACVALADFYRWGYQYGHDLDPSAPIKVPGMGYQPPVIGYKDLLNFTALSIPDLGGWIIVGIGAIAFLVFIYEWRKNKNPIAISTPLSKTAVLSTLILFFIACKNNEPATIRYGEAQCNSCKMKIMDTRFGAAILNKKGKTYHFDDVNCLSNYIKTGETPQNQIAGIYVADFSKPKTLVLSDRAFCLSGGEIKSPMASGVACFDSETARTDAQKQLGGNATTVNDILK
jgi:copper chaperone NosL